MHFLYAFNVYRVGELIRHGTAAAAGYERVALLETDNVRDRALAELG